MQLIVQKGNETGRNSLCWIINIPRIYKLESQGKAANLTERKKSSLTFSFSTNLQVHPASCPTISTLCTIRSTIEPSNPLLFNQRSPAKQMWRRAVARRIRSQPKSRRLINRVQGDRIRRAKSYTPLRGPRGQRHLISFLLPLPTLLSFSHLHVREARRWIFQVSPENR